ncbi:unnamed protein product [Rotaria magnacalcarata]|uniref:Uncharacterized protein n=1 Tax=Rotaria magnacalcarata TaxID=392030 RepID=A0A819PNB3_9BILA|nr:unnamed protein product [Rotaria magnacalcarata]CAF4015903.1 unnamed protein product [Rotaria magnacalcarata]
MMPIHFPYANPNSTGYCFYNGGPVYPGFAVNYNPYLPSFCSNSNRLLPTQSQSQSQAIMLPTRKSNKTNNNNQKSKPITANNAKINLNLISSHEDKKDTDSHSTVTFSKQITKPISNLNPFANEFSFVKNNNQILSVCTEKDLSYKTIVDNLIEQSLQSIEAIKKASKKISVSDVSIQHCQSIEQTNHSTQTNDTNLLEEYSSCTVELMNKLFENFKYLLSSLNENDLYNQLKLMSHTFDELHYSILFINQMLTLNKSSMNRDNLFSNMIKELSFESSPIIFGKEKRIDRLISSSISYSSIPSVCSRQTDSIVTTRPKLCLLCRRPVDISDGAMHELCRLLSSPPDISNEIFAEDSFS